MIFWAQMRRLPHEDDKSVELPTGYELDAAGTNLLLKRPSGFLIAAFGEGVSKDSIRHVAEADERYSRAIQRQEEFGSAADSRPCSCSPRMLGKPERSSSGRWKQSIAVRTFPPPTMVLLLRRLQGSTALARCEAQTGLRSAPPAARNRNS